jgi:hypothetical protein
MPDDRLSARPSRETKTSAPRCREIFRTDCGWERCHLDEHNPGTRHHVRDRSWLSSENTPRLRLGQPCGAACTWPDLVIPYRRGTGQGLIASWSQLPASAADGSSPGAYTAAIRAGTSSAR